MKMLFIIMLCTLLQFCNAQEIKINYFGQSPPNDTPKKFAPGIISKADRYELMAAFSGDGKEFCFTVTNKGWSHFQIWSTKYSLNKWSEPKIIPFLYSSEGFGPVFAHHDSVLFFSSANWVTHPATIWYSQHLGKSWGKPIKLASPVNSGADQWQFSIAKDNTMVFSSKRPGGKGGYDLYIADAAGNQYKNVRNLTELNSPADEYSAFIATDKSYIIFSSQRKGGNGWDDLYISFRKKDNGWTKPINLGPKINTANAEFSPQVTPDNKYLIYSVWDINQRWSDIYWVRIDKLIQKLKSQAFAD